MRSFIVGGMRNGPSARCSDTQTRPTAGMRAAMARAELGDEQSGSDPTTNALCARVAALLGMEDAVFMPSGALCNLTAILVQNRPGDEIVADDQSHIFNTRPLATLHAVRDTAKTHGLKAHVDGARLLNAVAATGIGAADYVAGFDSA